jgi:dephospho-CoA kinase
LLLVGLTGGIGSGKTTVAGLLEKRGAVVFDADRLAREAVARGTAAHDRVVERFGPKIVGSDGEIDREALAEVVFADPGARRDLEAIVHTEVRRLFAEGVAAYRGTDKIVVLSAPLLVETAMDREFQVLIVVSAPEETQVERLTRDRRMSEADVRSRIGAQMPLEAKTAVADIILDNGGTLEELEGQVDCMWDDLVARAEGATS